MEVHTNDNQPSIVASSVGVFPKRPDVGAVDAIVLIIACDVVIGTSPNTRTSDFANGEIDVHSSAVTVSHGNSTPAYDATVRTCKEVMRVE
jgi:hypothetical protein